MDIKEIYFIILIILLSLGCIVYMARGFAVFSKLLKHEELRDDYRKELKNKLFFKSYVCAITILLILLNY